MALIQRSFPWMWWRRRKQESAGVDLSPAADPLFEAGLRLRSIVKAWLEPAGFIP